MADKSENTMRLAAFAAINICSFVQVFSLDQGGDNKVLEVVVIAVVVLVVIGALARLGAFSSPNLTALPTPEPESFDVLKDHERIQWCQAHIIKPLIRRTGLEWRFERIVTASSIIAFKQLFLSCPSRGCALVIVFSDMWRPMSWSCLSSRGPVFELYGVHHEVDWEQLRSGYSPELMSLGLANAGAPQSPHMQLLLKTQTLPMCACKLWCSDADGAATLAWLMMESRRASLHRLVADGGQLARVTLLSFSRGPELSMLLARGESVDQELGWLLGGVDRWTSELERMAQWRPLTAREQTLPLVMDCFEDRRHVDLRWVAIWQIATVERLSSLRPMLKGKIMNDEGEPWQALLFGALSKDGSLYRRERYMEHYRRAWAQSRFDDGPDAVIVESDRWWFGLLGESLVELLSWEELWEGCLWRAEMMARWAPEDLAKLYVGLSARILREPRFDVEDLAMVTQLLRPLGQMPIERGQLLSCWLDRLERQTDDDELWRLSRRLQAPGHELLDGEAERDALYRAHKVVLSAAAKRFGARTVELWAAGPDHELGHRLIEALTQAAEGEALMALQELKGGLSRSARKRAEGAIKEIQDRLGRQHGELTISSVTTGGELTQVTAAQGSVTVVGGRDE